MNKSRFICKSMFIISFLSISLIACKQPKNNLIDFEDDYEIDLTDIDAVRENLQGFWIDEDELDSKVIIWMDFEDSDYSTTWEMFEYNEQTKRSKEFNFLSCAPIVRLILVKGITQMEFITMGGSYTTRFDYLSKSQFKLRGKTYLRHSEVDFIK